MEPVIAFDAEAGLSIEGDAASDDRDTPLAITAVSYPFTATTAALEDMSSGTTQLVAAGLDDTASAVTNIGFDFWYDTVRHTQFSVNANGLARLGPTVVSTAFDNSTGFATTTNAPKIAPFFEDLCVGTNGRIHFKVTGSAPNRKLVVEWQNMQMTRGTGCGNPGAGTFQMWLHETSGVIQFVYGAGMTGSLPADGGYTIGLQSGAANNFASVTTATDSVSYTTHNATQTNAIEQGKSYVFTPPVPAAPSDLTFTSVSPISMTLNWTDNATDEVGYVIYQSTDNVNFAFVTQLAPDANSHTITGLTPNTTYFFRVHALSEGALSPALAGSQMTNAAGNVSSIAPGGNWSDPNTWSGGMVPTAGDNVTISDATTVTIDTAASAFSITVGAAGPAVLQFESAAARSLTVGGDVTVNTNSTFRSSETGTVTTHTLSLGGSLTNNGTLDFSTNGDTAGAGITFTGASNASFTGTGTTTDIRAITMNKGASRDNVLELSTVNFTVRGATTDVAGYLTITNGTFRISGSFTITNRTFATAAYTIPATGGIWLNNPNYTVAPTASGTTTVNNGLFRLTQGTYNVGLTGADGLGGSTAGALFIIEGGTLNATRFDPQGAVTYTQTGGTVNVSPTVGNTRSSFGSFELFSSASFFNMSGGTINLIFPSTAATKVDWRINSPVANTVITGGTVVFGAGAAPAAAIYNVSGRMPGTTVNAGRTMRVNNALVNMMGTTVTNNGTIDFTGTSSRYDFTSQNSAMTYGGSGVFGTLAAPFGGVGISSNSEFLITLNAPIITNRVNLFLGGFINSNQFTLGNGGTSTTVVQIGSTGLTTSGGSFDVSPNHNQGSGGQIVLYAFETTPRTTGVEINPTRVLTSINLIDNPNHVTLAGGDLTLSSTGAAIVLTTGRFITGSNTLILSSGTATVTRTNGYVDGNFRKAYSGNTSKLFEVGTANGYSPATVNVTAGAPADVTVRAVQGKQPNIPGMNALQRYWQVTAPAGVTANLTFNYLAGDVVGNDANYLVYKYDGMFTNPPGSSVNTGTRQLNAPGQSSITADWTAAEPGALVVPMPGTVQFSSANYNAVEASGTATVNVTRTGGSDGAASVDYATQDGTATGGASCTAGVDFIHASGTLTWTDGDSAARSFTVTICNDEMTEGAETVGLTLSNAMGATLGTPNTATLTITDVEQPGRMLISELRASGPAGPDDEFVEIFNNGGEIVVEASDESLGYGLFKMGADCNSTPVLIGIIPNEEVIPTKGHYLFGGDSYSLGSFDRPLLAGIEDNANIALFTTTDVGNLSTETRLDAVGFGTNTGSICDLLREGNTLAPANGSTSEYSFLRKQDAASGHHIDINSNSSDFFVVSTTPATPVGDNASPRLGAPGPQNISAPTFKGVGPDFASSLIAPCLPATSAPNRVRDTEPGDPATSSLGTLAFRRTYVNQTGAAVSSLKFRVIDITTFPSPSGTADLRAISSGQVVVSNPCGGGTVTVEGTTLEEPPNQPNGGGMNSTLAAGTITLATPLQDGEAISVQLVVGVQQSGSYRFFVVIEAGEEALEFPTIISIGR